MATSAVNGVGEQRNEDDPFEPEDSTSEPSPEEVEAEDTVELPQCKIKRNYACPECPYFTQNPRIFLYHLKNFHQHKIRIYECPHCLYASKHSQKLQRHLQMVHVDSGKKKVSSKAKVSAEKKKEEQEEEDEDEEEDEEEEEDIKYETECFSPPLTTGEGDEKMFKCALCPFNSRSESLIARHEKVVHLKKRFFRCSKCNYVTHMKARFTKHVKYHSMPMIKCELCDFKTPYKWNLDRHMKNHSSDGAFKCSLCSFTADIKQSLTVHEMNHHVPPVGQGAPSKRRNRVGASDSQQAEDESRELAKDHDKAEAELLRLEREGEQQQQAQMQAFSDLSLLNEIEVTKKIEKSPVRKPNMKKPKSMAQFSPQELTMKIGQKVVNPGDVIQQKNGNVYVKKIKCRVCNYRAAWESEMTRHEKRVHGLDEKKSPQKPARPIPNLIPIQNSPVAQQSPPPPPPSLPLSRPTLPKQSRPMLQQKPILHPMPSHPHHFQSPQQGMNRHPFLPQHMQHQFNISMTPTPQTHNLPPHYPQQLPSRFAQPKHVMPKLKSQYPMNTNQLKQFQQKQSPPPPPILKIPTPTKVRTPASSPAISSPDKTMTEKDLNDICAKSCPTSSLKDFASLMGGDEAFKSEGEKISQKVTNSEVDKNENAIGENQTPEEYPKSPEATKKKNSFFDELKAKLKTGESCNLLCNLCGHESKCLSESLRHQKIHRIQNVGNSLGGGTVFSNADFSSTRCQYCRQRCKTSSDLLVHMKSCAEANRAATDPLNIDDGEEEGEPGEIVGVQMEIEDNEGEEEDKSEEGFEYPEGLNPHPMENKVFVWTNMDNGEEDGLDDEYDCGSQSPSSDCVFGIETAPGIGAVTSTNKAASHGNTTGQAVQPVEVKPKVDNSVKKVYKCPHCSFWASTASRFHVHIVGHLNKKPFECSLCCYRSNWRWDITKHIRLKTVRDSTHQRAKVLMTDETGRRNYSKYNKYLTLMRVHEPMAESSGSGQRGKKLTQSFEPIETIPSPPKLTPILQALDCDSSPSDSLNQLNSMSPKLPPLQPSFDMKRKSQEDPEEEPPKKKGPLENKKTMWKCKKCLFRDSDRAVVLAHVKGHYRNQGLQNNQMDSPDEASSKRLRLQDEVSQPYMCGHCHQVSQWKHVIQRHCRLKHNGDVKVNLAPRQHMDESEKNEEENEPESFMCETCPFIGSSQQSMDDHMEKHFERPGAIFKCYSCRFFVSDKEELLEHISLHGEPEADDNYSVKEEDTNYTYSSGGESGEQLTNKRYRCTNCPYVSNSKTQFLYHKQFHRPRGAPFQCSLCSYNVPRRHFLQQHLRLHGISTPIPRTKRSEQVDTEVPLNIKDIDTSNMNEIPLVWVSKLGSLTKMFKCRYCPHVNIRKSNIQEHEKMHGLRTKPNAEGSSPVPQLQHHCPECNYICNNAGVLSSHAKVHQGLFGQVCGLVDISRSDDEQIKELNNLLGRDEEGPPEITPDEIFKDFKDMSPQFQQSLEKDGNMGVDNRVLHFCQICPARFLYPKELEIHLRFHNLQLQFQCDSCSYTARQQPHLLAHYKVHTDEYQDRTTALCEVYQISEEHPKPKIAVIVDGSEEVGPAWVVVERQKIPAKDPQNEYDLDEAPSEVSQHGNRIVTKQFTCAHCPAKFFKSVALQYHSTLHGSNNPHKCRVCDYAVKTYGNLIKHETVHEELEPRVKIKNKTKRSLENIPTSGTELFKQKTEANQKVAAAPPPPPPPLHIDPEFGILMHGSPEFVYPTYLKNGRLKEKRYKCHKCPSAFEKREQYKVHLSLHGSKQRYNCERCDYSVKYYANYIQHLRKHQTNDVSKAERKMSTEKNTDDSANDDGSEATETPPVEEIQPQPPMSARTSKKMKLSLADQQTNMLMQQRIVGSSVSAPEVTYRCPHCPYTNQRKEGVGSHVKCHSNAKGGAFTCKHCDYTVPQHHFLREHNKLHFSPLKSSRPEAYMKCDRLELWAETIPKNSDDNQPQEKVKKVLIFKDKGVNFKEKRFLPAYNISDDNQENEESEKVYINIKTGEIETPSENAESSDKEDEKENVDVTDNDTISKDEPNYCSDQVENENEQMKIVSVNDYDIDENNQTCENDHPSKVCAEEENIPILVDEERGNDNFSILKIRFSENDTMSQNVSNDTDKQLADSSNTHIFVIETETSQNAEDESRTVNQDSCEIIDSRLGLDSFLLEDQGLQDKNVNDKTNENNLQESFPSNMEEEKNLNELQDGSGQQESNGESEDKSEVKDSSSESSDSDTEDSSSDSSSSNDSDDSTSSSAASSQQS